MVFKEIQHDMIFMQYKDGVLKKNKENPYLKWRTQGEEEPISEVLQSQSFSEQNKVHTTLYLSYKEIRVGTPKN